MSKILKHLIITIIKGGDVMSDAVIIYKAIIKMMKFFPLVVPTIILGLVVLAIDERIEEVKDI